MNQFEIILSLHVWEKILKKKNTFFKRVILLNDHRIYIYIYIYIYISSCRATSTDIPDALRSLLPSVHRPWLVFRATSRILTELLYVCLTWSSCFCSAICEVHRSTTLMSSSLLLRRCPVCLFRLTWIVFVMGCRWPYSWCLVVCYHQDLFNIARNILV